MSTRTCLPEAPIRASVALISLREMLPQANVKTVWILRDQMMLGKEAREDAEGSFLKCHRDLKRKAGGRRNQLRGQGAT